MKVIGVEFKNNNKTYYFNTNGFSLEKNINVIVETERGLQFGTTSTEEKDIDEIKGREEDMKSIVRIADKEDIRTFEKNEKDAELALAKASKIANHLDLNMNFIDANYTFDRNQLILYFLSDNRVDFRQLAKELATIYKTRIELRQVGVRDKAKEISGLGVCGRQLCCSCFLNDLDSVSISMAKNQNLALNPNKINGLCGRLLCCLKYEDELYEENKVDMPSVGEHVDNKHGKGVVTFVDIPNRRYIINSETEGKKEVKLESKCDFCDRKCNK